MGSRVPPAVTTRRTPARSPHPASGSCGGNGRALRNRVQRRDDVVGLREPASAAIRARQPPDGGIKHVHAARPAASRRWPAWPGVPTSRCASRGNEHRRVRCEQRVAEQVARLACRVRTQESRRSRGPRARRRPLWPSRTCCTDGTSSNVVARRGMPAERLPRGAPNKVERRRRGDDADGMTVLA